MRHFDVAAHQPHPPGYPVFILLAKAAHAAAPSEEGALGLLSAIAGALGVLAAAAVFRRCDRASSTAWPLAATGLAMTSPLYWFTAVRPLSDMSGLAAALAVQAMTLAAGSTRMFVSAAFCAGLASGLRSQVAWLTLPLLIVRGLWGWGTVEHQQSQGASRESQVGYKSAIAASPSPLIPALAAFAVGILMWFVPLVVITGGPGAFWRALSNQGAEDLGNISMLWTTHNARAVSEALYYALVAPWAAWPVAVAVLAAAAAGIGWAVRHHRGALVVLIAAFGPYAVFDLLFQETFTSRYALPLVVPIAYLAVLGLRWIPLNAGLVVAAAVAVFDAHVGGTSAAAYARQKAPAFRLLDDMAAGMRGTATPPVLAMDRKNALDFRRPFVWMNGAMPPFAQRLPAPAQHEWLEPVKYWNGGGRAAVWFVVDPKRTAIDLLQHGDPIRYRWPLAYPALLSGARPDEMDWYRVDRPEWYVGEGWSLTPEAAGVAEADHRGLAYGPIRGWMARDAQSMVIGGRNFESHSVNLTMTLADGKFLMGSANGAWTAAWQVAPGPFVRLFDPRTTRPSGDLPDYVSVDIAAVPTGHVAIEQFDASAQRSIFGFGAGWHEPEFNPRTGMRWRWLSERGELNVRTTARRLSLHLEGESPRKYFSRGSRLAIRAGGARVFDRVLDDDFSFDVPIENVTDTILLETDQIYVPAERSRRTQDRRHLGLRIFRCEVRQP